MGFIGQKVKFQDFIRFDRFRGNWLRLSKS